MSLILDALKKLDREKLSRRDRPANIAVEILRPPLSHPERKRQIYVVAIFLTAVVTAAITYALIAGFGFLSKSSAPQPVNPPASREQAGPVPLEVSTLPKPLPRAPTNPPVSSKQVAPAPPEVSPLPQPAPTAVTKVTVPSPQVAPPPPEAEVLPRPSPAPTIPPPPSPPVASPQVTPAPPETGSLPKSLPPAPADPPAPNPQAAPAPPPRQPARGAGDEVGRVPPKAKSSEASLDAKKESPGVIPEKMGIAPEMAKKSAEPASIRSSTTPPALKLTAVVWYEDPSRRFAFVNGTKVREGDVIEGVKVVEIHPDRVRFLHNDRQFEISLFQ